MSAFVVDVNVPIVANGHTPQADVQCVSACVGALQAIVQGETIVLDDGMAILREYLRYLSPRGRQDLVMRSCNGCGRIRQFLKGASA